jgi:hypothetical protein
MSADRLRSGALVATIFVAYAGIASIETRPLLSHLSTSVAGDTLDPIQTIWGFWWLRHFSEFSSTPFWTPLLWWPEGTTLWFQTWDIPAALMALPLWSVTNAETIYNLSVFVTFPLAGVSCYLLVFELWNTRLAAFLSGCLYTFSTFHFAAATANLHIASIEWLPLSFWGMVRFVRSPSFRASAIAGIGLALATLASVYHLLACCVAIAIIVAVKWSDAMTLLRRRVAVWTRCCGLLVFACAAGWLLVGEGVAYATGAYVGQHDPVRFSLDIQSLFVPNAISQWRSLSGLWRTWGGSEWQTGGYVGYTLVALALYGGYIDHTAKTYVIVAIVGICLALGPVIHMGGRQVEGIALPYAWLARAWPPLAFGGIPARFAWLTTFGLSVAAGRALAMLCGWSARGRIVAVIVTAIAVTEAWPHRFPMVDVPSPRFLSTIADTGGDWAILDGTADSIPLWHQMVHGHPIVAGYITRIPEKAWIALVMEPELRALCDRPFGVNIAMSHGSGERVLERLRALNIRFVIVDAARRRDVASIGLRLRATESGQDMYEVPFGSVGARDGGHR